MQVCFSSGASVNGSKFSVARYSLILSRQASRQFSLKKESSAEDDEAVEDDSGVVEDDVCAEVADFADEDCATDDEELDDFADEDDATDDELTGFFEEELTLPFELDEDSISSEDDGKFSTSWDSYLTTETLSEQAQNEKASDVAMAAFKSKDVCNKLILMIKP